MKNEDLVERIQRGENVKNCLTALWMQNSGIITSLAKKYEHLESFDDIRQELFFILRESAEMYDPAKGANFLTYFISRAGHLLRDRARKEALVKIPRDLIGPYYKYLQLKDRLPGVTDREACATLGISSATLRRVHRAEEATRHSISFDAPTQQDEDLTIGDAVADPDVLEDSVTDRLYNDQLHEELSKAISRLKDGRQKIIIDHYYGSRSLSEIAQDTGKSYGYVSEERRAALKELSRNRSLYDFAENHREEIEANPYRHTGLSYFRSNGESSIEAFLLKKEQELEKLYGIKADLSIK